MLHPETKRIADELTGYVPFTEEECQEQFPCRINYDPNLYNPEDENAPDHGLRPKTHGKLMLLKPEAVEDSLEGWYLSFQRRHRGVGTRFNLPNTGRR